MEYGAAAKYTYFCAESLLRIRSIQQASGNSEAVELTRAQKPSVKSLCVACVEVEPWVLCIS